MNYVLDLNCKYILLCLFPTLHWKVLNKIQTETKPPQIKINKTNTTPSDGNYTTVKEKAVMKYLSVEEK